MKRIRHFHSLQRNSIQKSENSQSSQSYKSNYLKSLKIQAIKGLCNVQKDILNKNKLNVTVRQSWRSSQYKNKSQQKEPIRKTIISIETAPYAKIIKKQTPLENYPMNIKKLLRLKAEMQLNQSKKLKNPFYKIQKCRVQTKNINCSQTEQPIQTKQGNRTIILVTQTSQNLNQKMLISKDKKQQYLAQKKYRMRTMQYDQAKSVFSAQVQKNQINNNNLQNSFSLLPKFKENSKNYHSRRFSTVSRDQNSNILQYRKTQRLLLNDQQDVLIQVSRQYSPVQIRQKSLTIKYNQIKDYFQKKYLKNSGENLQNSQGHSNN